VLVCCVFGKPRFEMSAQGSQFTLLSSSKEQIKSSLCLNLRRTPRSLQKGTLADLTLDILCLLVDLELGFGDFGVFVFAVALGGCFCSLFPTWSVRLYGRVSG
jgi:hypothetical protein